MRFWILFLVYGIFFLAIQSAWQLTGDFLLLAVIYFAFYEESLKGLGVALLFGFLLDVVSYSPFGTGAVSFGFTYGLIRLLKTTIFFRSLLARFIWIALFSFINSLCAYGWTVFFTDLNRPFSFLLRHFVGEALINALLGIFWFGFLRWYRGLTWEKVFQKRDDLLVK